MGCSPSMNATSNVDTPNVNVNISKSQKEESNTSSATDFIENSILVWLTDQPLRKISSYTTQLRHVISALKIFDNPDTCYTFLTNIQDEIIFLIISTKYEDFIKKIDDLPQIYKIYIFDQTTEVNVNDTHDKSPHIDIVQNINSLCDQLTEDRKLAELDSILLATINPSTPNGISTKRTGAFLIGQYMKYLIVRLKFDTETKSIFADFCRAHYANDKDQLRCIDDFDKNYRPKEVSKWLIGNSFVARVFNRVQRVPEIDLMYKAAFMMKHMHMLLANFYENVTTLLDNISFNVYRGKTMSQDEFNNFTEDITGGFLSSRAFLVASTNKNLTIDILRRIITCHPQRVGVLFDIYIDPTKTATAPFALLESNGDEFCFTLGTIFRVESIEKSEDFSIDIWIVRMVAVADDSNPQLSHLLKQVRSDEAQANPSLYFAKLFMDAGYLHRVERHFFQFLQDKSLLNQPRRFARISFTVGNLLVMKNEFEKATNYYERALHTYLSVLKPDHPDLIPIYKSLGECYSKTNKHELALENYEKAAQIMYENNFETLDQDTMNDLNNRISELKNLA